MKRFGVILVFLLAGCPEGPSTTKPNRGHVAPIDANRQYSAEAWQSEVLQSAEPVLVDFSAPWCGPCLQMNPTIAALAEDFRVHKVNIDKNNSLAKRYEVSGIPLLLIFKDGKEAARFEGVTSEKTLRKTMEKLAAKGAERDQH